MTDLPPKIRTSARRLRYATLVLIAVYELGVLFSAWVLVSGQREAFPALRIEDQGLARWPAAISLLAVGALFGLALLRLGRMLRKVESGAPFEVARDLRGFAFYLFLATLATLLAWPLSQIALAIVNGDAHQLHLEIGSGQVFSLLITALLFLVARLLDEAQRLADDHSQIV